MRIPDFPAVLEAKTILAEHLAPTPTVHQPVLSRDLGLDLYVKHENVQPTGAFKVRGGLNLMAEHVRTNPGQGVVAYSTGNHAQSVAYAARAAGLPCVIVMPVDPNPAKARAVRELGAELLTHGATFDESKDAAVTIAAERGYRLISAADEPAIIAGVATCALELLTVVPRLDAIFVPAGSGSGAAAACLVTAAIAPDCQVIAVQSAAAPAAHDSWRAGSCVRRPNRTEVGGLATGAGFALTQHLMAGRLTDFLLITDDAIRQAQARLLRDAHTLSEGAGAAALAGLMTVRERYAGRRVAVICTGANASEDEIRTAVDSM